jgi:hypothetical protein
MDKIGWFPFSRRPTCRSAAEPVSTSYRSMDALSVKGLPFVGSIDGEVHFAVLNSSKSQFLIVTQFSILPIPRNNFKTEKDRQRFNRTTTKLMLGNEKRP